MTFNFEKLRSPMWVFIIYMVISNLLVFVYFFIIPSSPIPLIIFSREWRQIQGILGVLNLFPALALSALVIPFGFRSDNSSSDEKLPSFSQILFKRLIASVIIVIVTAIIYAIIYFLFIPMAENYEEELRFNGDIYHLARERSVDRARSGDWYEAAQYLAICDQIWPQNRDLDNLREEIDINLELLSLEESRERQFARTELARDYRGVEITPLYTEDGQYDYLAENQALTAAQAIALSETAFEGLRFFDAHWLASLGRELARPGSPEAARASQLASEAWNMIASQAPNPRELNLLSLYEMKVSGYREMSTENWINAYYIFRELAVLTPDDPDVINFLALSERKTREIAFFIDEIELSLGETLTSGIFSIPGLNKRAVLRFSSLVTSKDTAYGIGLEYMDFDDYSNPITSVRAPYSKIIPSTLNDIPKTVVLTHALDRYNENLEQAGEWLLGSKPPEGIVLDISFDDFLLLASVRRGLPNMELRELYQAAEKLGGAGYITQIFETEILTRLGTGTFLLPLGIIVIVTAWRNRTIKKPRYFFIILLPVLPVVFHGLVNIIKTVISLTSVWLVLTFGFSTAFVLSIVFLIVSILGSLIVLAAQHS